MAGQSLFAIPFFVGRRESPTVGQVQVAACVERGQPIPQDLGDVVLAQASREWKDLAQNITDYNLSLGSESFVGGVFHDLSGVLVKACIADSYGEASDDAYTRRYELLREGVDNILYTQMTPRWGTKISPATAELNWSYEANISRVADNLTIGYTPAHDEYIRTDP